MNIYRLSGAFAALAAFASDAAADGTTHAMGYLPPPKGGFKVQRVGSPKARALLGATRQVLPERYDLREEGWVSPVKNQGDHGNCWSFAPCAALESHFLKTGRGEFDLSEKNIVNLSGWEPEDRLDGGFDTMAFAYMTRWTGPGAWIVKNSWGTHWGDEGYFYVSFYDRSFGKDFSSAYIPAGEGEDYDVVRGHDLEGPVFDASSNNSPPPDSVSQ